MSRLLLFSFTSVAALLAVIGLAIREACILAVFVAIVGFILVTRQNHINAINEQGAEAKRERDIQEGYKRQGL